MNRRHAAAPAGVVLAAAVVYFTVPDTGPMIACDLIAVGAVAALAYGLYVNRTPVRLAWLLLLTGLTLTVVGDLVWNALDAISGPPGFPGPADGPYLLAYPFTIAGVVLLARRIGAGSGWIGLLDSALVATALLGMLWDAIAPFRAHEGLSTAGQVVVAGYPVLDMLLLAAVARLLVTSVWKVPSYGLLVGALALLLAGDVGYTRLGDAVTSGRWVSALWLCSYVLWAAAALHPSVARLGRPLPGRPATSWSTMWVIVLAAIVVPVALTADAVFSGHVSLAELCIGAVLIVLLLWRLALLLHELERGRELVEESEGWFRALTSGLVDVITVLDARGIVTYQSASLTSVTGHEEDDLLGRDPLELVHPDDRERVHRLFRDVIEHGRDSKVVDFRFRMDDGSYRVLEAAMHNLLDDPLVRGVVVTSLDVTEHRRAAERFLTVFENAPDAIVIVGDDGRVIRANPETARMSGYAEDELVGRSFMDLVHPDDQPDYITEFAQLLAQGSAHGRERRFVRKDGSEIWTQLSASFVADPAGGPAYVIGQFSDVTGRREAEAALAEQNERLVESDRLKDELIAVVSHDLRTPLTSIIGYAELLLDEQTGPLNDEQRYFLGILARNGDRLLHLVDDLLLISRLESGRLELERERLDLCDLAGQCAEAAGPRAVEAEVELRVEAPEPVAVVGDPGRLAELLDNLVSNAIKFTRPGGSVELRLRAVDGRAVVEVADTGVGIEEDDRRHLFERFYRGQASDAVPGTGLGLAIAKAIVDSHGGTISVESDRGRGSTFAVELPLAGTPAAVEPVSVD